MTSVTQKIPRYTLGVTDQPDELKLPGQLVKAENVVPDLTLGLLKRPGFKYISDLTDTSTGKWFHINKNNAVTGDERYIGQITTDGYVHIWDLNTGKEMDITYGGDTVDPSEFRNAGVGGMVFRTIRSVPGPEDYFIHNDSDNLHVMSVNDYTFVTNRRTTVSMSNSVTEKRPYEAFISLQALAYKQNYILDFDKPGENEEGQPPVVFTTASKVSVAPVGWNLSTYCNSPPGCLRAGQWTTDLSSGDKTGLNVTITSSCVGTPDGCGISETYSLSITLNSGGENWQAGDTIDVNLGGNPFRVTVSEIRTTTTTKADEGRANYVVFDTNTTLDAGNILEELANDIEGFDKGYTTEVIGTGLYVTNDYPFVVSTPDPVLLDVMSVNDTQEIGETEPNYITQVNNIARLPQACKHLFIAKVVNTGATEDDYYVQFYGNNGLDGEGVWEECAKPGIPHTINPFTMPHAIIRTATTRTDDDGDLITNFWVGALSWTPREAGDEITNPRPTFCPPPGANFGQPITATLFYRNRLVFLSNENVIMSRAGDFFSLFGKSALTVTEDDPIDVATSSTNPAMLYSGIGMNAGLILFGAANQYLLTNDNDILSPITARVTPLSSYDFNIKSKPFSLGSTIGFYSASGKFSRLYELVDINRDVSPTIVETSRTVSTILPGDLDSIEVSKENGIVAATSYGRSDIWMFRYFQLGQRRGQAAWFNWKMDGALVHHAFISDSYYLAIEKEGTTRLIRADVKELYDTTLFGDDNYRIHLDYYDSVAADDLTYANKHTTCTSPIPIFPDHDIVAFSGDGRYTPDVTVDGTTLSIKGDWTNDFVVFGYNFTADVEFPVIYRTQSNGEAVQSDTRSSLVVHRVVLNLGDIGSSDIILSRKGRSDYTYTFESAFQDGYKAENLAFVPDAAQVVPIYDRNTNVELHLKSTNPSPMILHSMDWEGDYNSRYYQRV